MKFKQFLLFVVVFVSVISSRTITVDTTSDISSLISSFVGGDTCLISGGNYFLPTIKFRMKGSVNNYVVIKNVPGEVPVLTGNSSMSNFLSFKGAEYVIVEGLKIDSTPDGVDGLKFESGYSSNNIIIRNCEFNNIGSVSINSKGIDDHHITIENCYIHNNSRGTAEGMYIGHHDGSFHPHHWLIQNNHIHDTKGVQGDGIEIKMGCYAMKILNNVIYNNQYPSILTYGYNIDTTLAKEDLTLIEGNVVWNAGEAIGCYADVIVRNNIVFASSYPVLSMKYKDHKNPTEVFIYNNTFFYCKNIRLNSWNAARNCVFSNNLVYNMSESIAGLEGSGTITNNVGSLTGEGFSFSNVDTDLVDPVNNDFYPKAGSSIINSASGLYIASTDFDGKTRDSLADIGAYEWELDGASAWPISDSMKVVALEKIANAGVLRTYISILSVSPNPFNPNTTIKLNVAKLGKNTINELKTNGSTLQIYNLLGKLVYTSSSFDSKYVWNASSLSSGVYLVYLKIGNKTYSQRAILNK